jgi:hypothetical protein
VFHSLVGYKNYLPVRGTGQRLHMSGWPYAVPWLQQHSTRVIGRLLRVSLQEEPGVLLSMFVRSCLSLKHSFWRISKNVKFDIDRCCIYIHTHTYIHTYIHRLYSNTLASTTPLALVRGSVGGGVLFFMIKQKISETKWDTAIWVITWW